MNSSRSSLSLRLRLRHLRSSSSINRLRIGMLHCTVKHGLTSFSSSLTVTPLAGWPLLPYIPLFHYHSHHTTSRHLRPVIPCIIDQTNQTINFIFGRSNNGSINPLYPRFSRCPWPQDEKPNFSWYLGHWRELTTAKTSSKTQGLDRKRPNHLDPSSTIVSPSAPTIPILRIVIVLPTMKGGERRIAKSGDSGMSLNCRQIKMDRKIEMRDEENKMLDMKVRKWPMMIRGLGWEVIWTKQSRRTRRSAATTVATSATAAACGINRLI